MPPIHLGPSWTNPGTAIGGGHSVGDVVRVVESVPAAVPDWYFQGVGLDWWVRNLFDTPAEVHTFELGVLIGILVGMLAIRADAKFAVVSTLGILVFLLGGIEPPFICRTPTSSCMHLRVKPWYFLSGWTIAQSLLLGVFFRTRLRAFVAHR